jgi:isocitrate/isopropylmalate dehydrogenase
MATTTTPITVAHGGVIGPEIIAAALEILKAGGARLAIDAGENRSGLTLAQGQ